MNLRPSGYEPDELPDCSTPRPILDRTSRGEILAESGHLGQLRVAPNGMTRSKTGQTKALRLIELARLYFGTNETISSSGPRQFDDVTRIAQKRSGCQPSTEEAAIGSTDPILPSACIQAPIRSWSSLRQSNESPIPNLRETASSTRMPSA